jgi:hypothetical protein
MASLVVPGLGFALARDFVTFLVVLLTVGLSLGAYAVLISNTPSLLRVSTEVHFLLVLGALVHLVAAFASGKNKVK